ncbi:hypothetical protein DIPPA_34285 [Diplonema papillatum]|nr:hypothetical protein DIPPA_34285 [Diplonema papillatum]
MDTTEKILVVLVAMSGTFFVISLVAVCWGLRWRERAAEQYGIIEHYESSQGSFENQKWQANSRPEEELAVIPAASSSKQLPAPHHRELDAFSPHARQEQRRQRTAIVRQLLYMQFNASALYGSKKSVARRFFNR